MCNEARLQVHMLDEWLNERSDVTDEVQRGVVTSRVPQLEGHLIVVLVLDEEIGLQLHLGKLVRTGMLHPVLELLAVRLADEQRRNSNAGTGAIIAHDDSLDIFFLVVIND